MERMKLTSNELIFLTKSTRKSKSDKMYYLYTFMAGDLIYPTVYSDIDFDVTTGEKVTITLDVGNYNNAFNFKLVEIMACND